MIEGQAETEYRIEWTDLEGLRQSWTRAEEHDARSYAVRMKRSGYSNIVVSQVTMVTILIWELP